ncbi:hypothetical protein EZJ19_13780 [Parasulfuritortus cantonensis]|uniref:NnrS family protein n=1 Tax=Parasulfuritortus cantonensis TaxID=2528202 RepID=A0A4R1B703_9PROT|nr:hypothetical protein [Parasulfuritortus cantonensis]TCJ11875.1 hypothetical protein EZJ19_13780 [Parasulfuritortus cantonensis]
MLVFLVAATLALLLAGLALPVAASVSAPFAAHLVLALAVMSLITAAMQHFVPVLVRGRGAGRWLARLPWLMALAGALAAAVFGGWLAYAAVTVAALVGLAGAATMLAWMTARARAALGPAHPGLAWYVAAMACLALGLAAAALIPWLPGWHAALRAFHVHINLYGFVGLTAVGTLQVLMPTVAGRPDPDAAARLRRDLVWAASGALMLAAGKAFDAAVPVWLGIAAWAWPLARLARAWVRLHGRAMVRLHGGEPVLAAALFGFACALVSAGRPDTAPLAVFLPGFLFPLVSGAAGHLAPVWARPGAPAAVQAEARRRLNRHGGLRALLFATAAVLPALAYPCAGMPGLTALVWFLALFAAWLWKD